MKSTVEVRTGARTRRLITPLVTALLASPAVLAAAPEKSWWRPVKDISKDGFRATDLFWYTTWMCVVAFALVWGALVWFSIRYRARPGHRALYDHGTRRASIVFTTILALAVFILIDMNLVRASQVSIKEYLYNY